jgi:hypothetical protein
LTRRPIPALVTALGVLAFFEVRVLVQEAVYFTAPINVGQAFLATIWGNIAFALGVFLVLWLVLPVHAATPTARAIVAGVVAAVAGSILWALSGAVVAFVIDVQYGLPPLALLTSSILTAIAFAPLTVLAAILLREWSRSKVATSPEVEPAEAV